MKTLIWAFRDKTSWGHGPWQAEPDKKQWLDVLTGLPCLAVRSPVKVWCGYVGVLPGHSLYGKDYADIEDTFNVHGGLTFSGAGNAEKPEGIYYVPDAGEEKAVWWFGFDCGHGGDIVPGLWDDGGEYRTLNYVEYACASLAQQLRDAMYDTP